MNKSLPNGSMRPRPRLQALVKTEGRQCPEEAISVSSCDLSGLRVYLLSVS